MALSKQRKWIIGGVLVLVAGLMTFLVLNILHQLESRKLREAGTPMPAFHFQSLATNADFTQQDLPADKPVAVFFLHPECEHCQSEAQQLGQNLGTFADCEVMLVSTAPGPDLMAMAKAYGLTGLPNIHILRDSAFRFEEWFGETPFPTALAYNRARSLRGHFAGGTRMEAIRAKMDEP